jgi:hypothetical protein
MSPTSDVAILDKIEKTCKQVSEVAVLTARLAVLALQKEQNPNFSRWHGQVPPCHLYFHAVGPPFSVAWCLVALENTFQKHDV